MLQEASVVLALASAFETSEHRDNILDLFQVRLHNQLIEGLLLQLGE